MTQALSLEFITVDEHRRVVEAIHHSYRLELGKQGMQLARYAAALEEAGVERPDATGDELLAMWRQAAAVVNTASAFVAHLGTEKELIFPMVRR